MTVMPELDYELCTGCGSCSVACHGGAITEHEGKVRILETQNCDYCGLCEVVCPHRAINCWYVVVAGEEEVESS